VNKYKLLVTESKFIQQGQQLCDFTSEIEVKHNLNLDDEIYLRLDKNGLHVCWHNKLELNVKDIYTNFRTRYKDFKYDLLIKAIQEKPENKTVLDITSGLGKDSLIMARYGFKVTMLEANPLLVTIVYYALQSKIIPNTNLTLIYANSLNYLQNKIQSPDIIYLDPMFNDEKTALAKKDMQLIQAIVPSNDPQDTIKLFNLAHNCVKHKIIVKRDNKLPAIIASPKVTYAFSGSTVRFDIYVVK
jgi:16S rRNA G966 N2-methylase RsmD